VQVSDVVRTAHFGPTFCVAPHGGRFTGTVAGGLANESLQFSARMLSDATGRATVVRDHE
jgi:hypothetical protein